MVDWMLHAGPMIAAFVILANNPALADKLPRAHLWMLASWPILSFVDRVVVQRLFHATVGKLLFGLVTIRPEDGGWPGFGRLVKVWLGSLFLWILVIISFGDVNIGEDPPAFGLPAVRRKDIGTDHPTST
ncbi:RDD family protein [Nocardia terpenica]|nr:RDD family protein [Nocardia terpenica]MBF6111393.1 RDD family protein [Nocardia terpenica]MBF6118454.1 RDD family protein [Nocardia terpenica]MBF6155776.1 RDD family protein [Nocardia terpenica]